MSKVNNCDAKRKSDAKLQFWRIACQWCSNYVWLADKQHGRNLEPLED